VENDTKIKLFLVDDDAVYLKSLEIQFLDALQFEVKTFATGELCIQNLSDNPDVIILDFHLDGIDKNAMNGLKTLDIIKSINSEIPIMFFILLICSSNLFFIITYSYFLISAI
jgi:CheY-like chemotaxis protein